MWRGELLGSCVGSSLEGAGCYAGWWFGGGGVT